MRLLIISSESKLIHLQQFGEYLKKLNLSYKLIEDLQYLKKFNIINKKKWNKEFEKLLDDYEPNVVLLDRQSELWRIVKKKKIPLIVSVRGDLWEEEKWAKEKNKSLRFRIAYVRKKKIINDCLKNADIIFTLSDYLTKIVKNHYNQKKVLTFPLSSRDKNYWKRTNLKKLNHPCVGLLQGAAIWGKTKEMLILSKIIPAFPSVTFYWAGDGEHAETIISELKKFKNFVWLGKITYPNEVKEYLTELDIFALVSGMDTFGQVVLEGSLLERPIIATKVGGIPEVVKDGKTGFLIEEGDYKEWIKKIKFLLSDQKRSQEIGRFGRDYIISNYDWENTAKKFVEILNQNKLIRE